MPIVFFIVWFFLLGFLSTSVFPSYPPLFWIATFFIVPLILIPIINGHP